MESRLFSFLAAGVSLLLVLAGVSSAEQNSADSRCEKLLARPSIEISAGALESAIAAQINEVAEFRQLRSVCESLGVRCWLFGGTAAGFGHYVKWDLLQKNGDSRFQRDRFDYDYSNIYRSTQDADLVIDGTEEQASRIEAELRETYPHLQGRKSVWEVRLLRSKRGEKEALLDSPDFSNQHTDSNSTGLIEVSRPPQGESIVRDARDWDPSLGSRHAFFQDLLRSKLHFYFSDRHAETSRFREGKNPPIFSVIRYLTKAFQYELEILPEDERTIRELIEAFDPDSDLKADYARQWLEKNGKKLFMHAVNLEYAWNVLEGLGLRRRLIELGDPEKEQTLAWWMNREPLRTRPLGNTGLTAKQLGIGIVAHETADFLAYESITRAHTGEPNVFESRPNAKGESAAHGRGFYAAVGKRGARGTGLTVRFQVNPRARLGSDFELAYDVERVHEGSYVVFRNKAAMRVIPESLNIGPVEYFELIAQGRLQFDSTDLGVREKLSRRIGRKFHQLDKRHLDRIERLVRETLDAEQPSLLLWSEYALHFKEAGIPFNRDLTSRIESRLVEFLKNEMIPDSVSSLLQVAWEFGFTSDAIFEQVIQVLRKVETHWSARSRYLDVRNLIAEANAYLDEVRFPGSPSNLKVAFGVLTSSGWDAATAARDFLERNPGAWDETTFLESLEFPDGNKDESTWGAARKMLRDRKKLGPEFVARVEELTRHPSKYHRAFAFQFLSDLYDSGLKGSIEVILQGARDSEPAVLSDVIHAMKKFKISGPEAFQLSSSIFGQHQSADWLPSNVIDYMIEVQADHPETIPFLLEAYDSRRSWISDSAKRGLARMASSDSRYVRKLLGIVRNSSDTTQMALAAQSLGSVKTLLPEVVGTLIETLNHPDELVAWRALEALGNLKVREETVIEAILSVAQSRNEEQILSQAATALFQIAPQDPRTHRYAARALKSEIREVFAAGLNVIKERGRITDVETWFQLFLLLRDQWATSRRDEFLTIFENHAFSGIASVEARELIEDLSQTRHHSRMPEPLQKRMIEFADRRKNHPAGWGI